MNKEKTLKKKLPKIIITILLIFFIVFSVVSFIVIKVIYDNTFARTEMSKYTAKIRYEDVADEYERELISFESGQNRLKGYLYGAHNTKGLVVISHGLGGGAQSYLPETLYFVDNGYQVFGYDNTGCRESEGKNCVGLSQSTIDLDAALTYIEAQTRFEDLPVFLYGHSWGGYAVTSILNYEHEITATASVAGFNEPMTMIIEWAKDMMGDFAYVEYPYIYLYQLALFGENANMTAVDGINSTDTPVLIIHGNEDTTVSYNVAGTVAYKEEITNPNVQYLICEKEKQNGHNNLFRSLDAIEYLEELDAEYLPIYEQYHGEIPDEVLEAFYSKVDKHRASALDEEYMKQVLAFYEAAPILAVKQ